MDAPAPPITLEVQIQTVDDGVYGKGIFTAENVKYFECNGIARFERSGLDWKGETAFQRVSATGETPIVFRSTRLRIAQTITDLHRIIT